MTSTSGDPMLDLFQVLVSVDSARTSRDAGARCKSLPEFEREYQGVEVGYVRRRINETVNKVFADPGSKSLLDYGCGGSWWKDSYWPRFRRVVAVDVNRDNLEDIARSYRGANVELVFTRNGLIDCDERFDYVLSSSVVGYIHPRQAQAHLRACYGLLTPGGTLVLSRVRAYNLGQWLRGVRLQPIPEFSFTYPYTRRELVRALSDIGFRHIRYQEHGIWLPVGDTCNQQLFRLFPGVMQAWGPRIFPFFRFQHMFIADR